MTIANAARALNLRSAARHPRARDLPPLILMTDEARLPDPVAALAGLPRGSAVILRHYGDGVSASARLRLARDLARTCRRRGLRLLVAASPRLAAAVGAAGVHLPEWMVAAGTLAARMRRPGWIVTAACHSEAALMRAARLGADAALLAPVFPTASHPHAPALGAVRFARIAHGSPIPVYALGGVDAAGARRLAGSAAAGDRRDRIRKIGPSPLTLQKVGFRCGLRTTARRGVPWIGTFV